MAVASSDLIDAHRTVARLAAVQVDQYVKELAEKADRVSSEAERVLRRMEGLAVPLGEKSKLLNSKIDTARRRLDQRLHRGPCRSFVRRESDAACRANALPP